MVEHLSRLYAVLQMIKMKKYPGDTQARWFIRHEPEGELDGPFEATEIAYQIHMRDLTPTDIVINGETQQTFRIGAHNFLSRWARESDEIEHLLSRGLSRSIKERAEQMGLSELVIKRQLLGRDLTRAQELAYTILDLDPSSSADEIRRQHRSLALRNHPDRGGSVRRMKEINWAFDVVRDCKSSSAVSCH